MFHEERRWRMGDRANGRRGEGANAAGRAKNSARPARGCCLSPLAPVLSRVFGMASNLHGIRV
jgi:hypothetical protein